MTKHPRTPMHGLHAPPCMEPMHLDAGTHAPGCPRKRLTEGASLSMRNPAFAGDRKSAALTGAHPQTGTPE